MWNENVGDGRPVPNVYFVLAFRSKEVVLVSDAQYASNCAFWSFYTIF